MPRIRHTYSSILVLVLLTFKINFIFVEVHHHASPPFPTDADAHSNFNYGAKESYEKKVNNSQLRVCLTLEHKDTDSSHSSN